MKVQAKELYQQIGTLSPKAVADKLHQLADSIAGQDQIKLGHCYEILARTLGHQSKNHVPQPKFLDVVEYTFDITDFKVKYGSRLVNFNERVFNEDSYLLINKKPYKLHMVVAEMEMTPEMEKLINATESEEADFDEWQDLLDHGATIPESQEFIKGRTDGWSPALARKAFQKLVEVKNGFGNVGEGLLYPSIHNFFADWFADLHWDEVNRDKDLEYIKSKKEYQPLNKWFSKEYGSDHTFQSLDFYLDPKISL